MAYRTLELTLISAQDLKEVNHLSKMEVYAVVSISGDHRSQQRTPADHHNGKNPAWNSTLRFSLHSAGDLSRHVLHILLRRERVLRDRDVGEVRIPLSELLNGPSTFVSYQVRKHSGKGKARGLLNISYKFIDSAPYPLSAPAYPPQAAQYEEPVTAYPAGPNTSTAYPYPQGYPATSAGYGYSAPPQQAEQQTAYGYPPPPQAGYEYAPAQAGYGYAAAPQQAKKN